jgi:hypothetical protein
MAYNELSHQLQEVCADELSIVDHGELLQNILSKLSSPSSLSSPKELQRMDYDSSDVDRTITQWIWTSITASSNDTPFPTHTTFTNQWCHTLRLIREELLPHISPLELHSVASQSIVFAEEEDPQRQPLAKDKAAAPTVASIPFRILCLHLCTYALKQCPTPLSTRFKRWQSIVCETIRLFQEFCQHTNPQVAIDMWVNYTCPTALQVLEQLVQCNNQRDDYIIHSVGIFAGLIGTTSFLAERNCRTGSHFDRALNSALHYTIQLICTFFETLSSVLICLDEWSVWTNPWRFYTWKHQQQQQQQTTSRIRCDGDVEDIKFETQRQDLSWWIYRASKEDRVAQVETSWSTIGISCLAFEAFQERPFVCHPAFLWKVWFPHATQMMKEANNYSGLQDISFNFLQSLLNTISVRSLIIPNCNMNEISLYERPDVPVEIVQLLSIQMTVAPNRQTETSSDGQMQHRQQVTYILGMIRELLNRYASTSQLAIVDMLVHGCPNPALQARFLDLLRPILLESECQDKLWRLLDQQLDILFRHFDRHSQFFVDVEDLIQNVEFHVSTLALIKWWAMGYYKKRPMTSRIKKLRQDLCSFRQALDRQLDQWSCAADTTTTKSPDNFYRLNLLEATLQNILT